MEQKREKFSSGLAIFFATLSSAVGLGNIWLFPYVVGENGGAAFILVYFACIALIGIPAVISEFIIGRNGRTHLLDSVSKISNKKAFKGIGYLGVLSTYCMLFFYTVVVGWVYSYVIKAIMGEFKGISPEGASEMFNIASIGPISPIIFQLIALSIGGFVLALGVKKGIEKLTKVCMPILLVLLTICVIRSLTLPGAMEGVDFLLKPDFSKISFSTILVALGLAFFKLSVGTGTLITYSSYYTDDSNLVGTAAKVAVSDTAVSLLAGLAIFPAVFSFGLEPNSGPSLLFNSVPLIFSKMPGGSILSIIFFGLIAIAATMAMISLLEVLVAVYAEKFKMSRVKALIINIAIIVIIGSLAALSANPDGVLSHIQVFGNGFFDFFDKLTSLVLLPINGFLAILLVGHFISKKVFFEHLTNNGSLKNEKIAKSLYFVMRYITPILVIVVFVTQFI